MQLADNRTGNQGFALGRKREETFLCSIMQTPAVELTQHGIQ